MPELPEVQSVRRTLTPVLVGRSITRVEVLFPGAIQHLHPGAFCSRLRGQCIEGLERYGKYLVYRFRSGMFLLMHLRMTGRAVVVASGAEPDPYCRVRFLLDDGNELRFSDIRKFGRVTLAEDRTALQSLFKLGPEPLTPAFTQEALRQAMRGRISVKGALLDQRRVAGLGNIYADEALFRACIHPARAADTLTPVEIERLHTAVEDVLSDALKYGGTTIRNYVQGDGSPGSYAERLQVYGRSGESCRRCDSVLERMRVAGRGTTYCPHCQR